MYWTFDNFFIGNGKITTYDQEAKTYKLPFVCQQLPNDPFPPEITNMRQPKLSDSFSLQTTCVDKGREIRKKNSCS